MDALREMMARLLLDGNEADAPDTEMRSAVFEGDVSVENLARKIRNGEYRNIVVMSGAGISVSAGIPDFRSPKTGLYHNLQQYNLPYPEAVFEISFFKENPQPFFQLAKALYPGTFSPTPTHLFIKLLAEKGLLLRNYTQNIDTLERAAGISPDLIVEAHGSFATAHCLGCKKEFSAEDIKRDVLEGRIATCSSCCGVIKPDIVFFGESLPQRFWECSSKDFRNCDLLIVMGTSLKVNPFAGLVSQVTPLAPRLLINNEVVGMMMPGGFAFNFANNYRDVKLIQDCDGGVRRLVDLIGWTEEYDSLLKTYGLLQQVSNGLKEVAEFSLVDEEMPIDESKEAELVAALERVCCVGMESEDNVEVHLKAGLVTTGQESNNKQNGVSVGASEDSGEFHLAHHDLKEQVSAFLKELSDSVQHQSVVTGHDVIESSPEHNVTDMSSKVSSGPTDFKPQRCTL